MTDESKNLHKEKKIITKDEFIALNKNASLKMFQDQRLKKDALDVLIRADQHRWIHQNSWMGEPLLNLPQDMFAIQEIIWKTKPEYVIEVGVAWGGSMLFSATLLEVLGGKKVIGVDIYIPQDLRDRLNSHGVISKRLELIEGSSTSEETLEKLKSILDGSRRVLVILDSFHTHDHVLKELQAYSPFVGKGNYLICGDTIVEHIPPQLHRPRPWGPGNNPATAVNQFISNTKRFEIDKSFDQKLLFSCHPGGYLYAKED